MEGYRELELYIGPLPEWKGQKENGARKLICNGSKDTMRIDASVSKTVVGAFNTATLQMYNLSQDTRHLLKQDGGLGPVRLHQVHPALSLRGALPGPAALQGPWALGGGRAGFPRPWPEGAGCPCGTAAPPTPPPVSPRWRFGGLEFSPPHPETRFSEDLGIRWESP